MIQDHFKLPLDVPRHPPKKYKYTQLQLSLVLLRWTTVLLTRRGSGNFWRREREVSRFQTISDNRGGFKTPLNFN